MDTGTPRLHLCSAHPVQKSRQVDRRQGSSLLSAHLVGLMRTLLTSHQNHLSPERKPLSLGASSFTDHVARPLQCNREEDTPPPAPHLGWPSTPARPGEQSPRGGSAGPAGWPLQPFSAANCLPGPFLRHPITYPSGHDMASSLQSWKGATLRSK